MKYQEKPLAQLILKIESMNTNDSTDDMIINENFPEVIFIFTNI